MGDMTPMKKRTTVAQLFSWGFVSGPHWLLLLQPLERRELSDAEPCWKPLYIVSLMSLTDVHGECISLPLWRKVLPNSLNHDMVLVGCASVGILF